MRLALKDPPNDFNKKREGRGSCTEVFHILRECKVEDTGE